MLSQALRISGITVDEIALSVLRNNCATIRGDTLYLTGGVRHRWRATVPDTRVVVVAVAEHIEAVRDRPGR